MPSFRVTKYNPLHRDINGAYTRDDWTSFAQVGQLNDGALLSLHDYQQTENAYIEAAVGFMQEAHIRELTVMGLENADGSVTSIWEGATLTLAQSIEVIRAMLREEFWCRLEAPAGYVHIGWDFYMYVGVPIECPAARAGAERSGLFVEPFNSPYAENAA